MFKRLGQIMVKDVTTVKPNATAKLAAELMNENEVSCLVVVSLDRPVGIVTEQDMLRKVVYKAKNPKKTRVSDIMSKPLIIATPSMQPQEAAKLMIEHKIRRLPIVEDGQLVGLVTLTDLIRAIVQTFKLL